MVESAKEDPKKKKKKERGVSDELEVLKMILEENSGLRMRVLRFLRDYKDKTDETIFDVVNKKSKISKKKSRNE